MTLPPDDRSRLKDAFAGARALPKDERPAYLAEACGGNDALRQEVESLLSSDERAKSFLEAPAVVPRDDTRTTRSLEGQRIGSFQIASRIGAGGMGEVYQAHDTTLNRQVAIKVLLPAVAGDPIRLARFRREARVLASLDHPHVAQIYGFEDADGIHALVMELVEGPTLADRLVCGAIPIDEAFTIASQIADALSATHEQGIIHRDLKPANVKIREDGTVKVLDFGLAKGRDVQRSAGGDVMQSPTLSAHATEPGLILGTAAYMSPEQARGKAVDRRTDLWAFGCVLYEMLTRQRAFGGDTPTDVLAAVVTTEPDWTRLPAETPAAIRTLLRRCLEKNRARRLDSATTARLEIDDARATPGANPSVQGGSRHLHRVSWSRVVIATVAITAAALAGVIGGMRLRVEPTVERTAVRFSVEPPEGLTFFDVPALSPDRRHLVLVATDVSRRRQLWLRTLDSEVARPIAGTEGAIYPFWSPDGQSIGFFADGYLKRVAAAGGLPTIICDAEEGRGGTWNASGLILFAPRGVNSGLLKVAASGGKPEPASHIDPAREAAHRWPHFLPDGNRFLYLSDATPGGVATLRVSSLQDRDSAVLIEGTTEGQYSDGLLFFVRRGVLLAQPFDVGRLSLGGEPQAIEQNVLELNSGRFAFSTTPDGALAFLRRANLNPLTQLTWFNRSGHPIGTVGSPARLSGPAIAPDDRRVAVTRHDEKGSDIWMFDLMRGTTIALTNDPPLESRWPLWSRDGRRVAYTASPHESQAGQMYAVSADAPGAVTTLADSGPNVLGLDWSNDGSRFLYRLINAFQKSKPGLWLLTLPGVSSAPFRDDGLSYGQATLSPDGRWVAYSSVDSGRLEVHIESFPIAGERVQVSTEGGTQPRWRRDQKELYFLAPDNRLMALSVDVADDVKLGTPAALFKLAVTNAQGGVRGRRSIYTPPLYDVTADGRFLAAIVQEEAAKPMPVTVSLTATAVVKRVAPQ